MSFEGSPFHSESLIVQAGHPQEREWCWLMFFQYHIAVVLYKQISGTSFNLEIAKLIETWQSL